MCLADGKNADRRGSGRVIEAAGRATGAALVAVSAQSAATARGAAVLLSRVHPYDPVRVARAVAPYQTTSTLLSR